MIPPLNEGVLETDVATAKRSSHNKGETREKKKTAQLAAITFRH